MEKKLRLAVLASTRGTDLQAIIDAMKSGSLVGVSLECVVSDKADCHALRRAREQGFQTFFVDPKGKTREKFDEEVAKILEEHRVDLVVLVGYMRILSTRFVEKFKNRIINVHPSLLPKFGGKNFFGSNVHEAVLAAGEKETGMTIHFVDDNVDTGKIIVQKKIAVEPNETPETLQAKVQELEKEWYPKVISMFANGEIT